MGISIEWEVEGIYVKAEGTVDYEELNLLFRYAIEDRRYCDLKYSLFDATEVEFITQDLKPLEKLSKIILDNATREHEFKLALVFEENTIEDAVERYLDLTKSVDRPAKVFNCIKDAREWLR